MENKRAVVLVSGGMDSALCTGIAIDQGFDVSALHLNYGQKTQNKELECFEKICDHYSINYRLVVDVSHFSIIGGSSLTDNSIEVPKVNLNSNSIPNSYVPFRNANILAIATSWAEVINAQTIFIGAMQLDSSGYPDCRREFFDMFEQVINLGTRPETKITISTPLIDLSKSDIVTYGIKLGVPFDKTWSCYKNGQLACGNCDSCGLRLRGFQIAGAVDPIDYEDIGKY